ncbi:MAG: aminotransferase class I/II-fold pyridoxal phosphate-dependent enzyme, partial [Coriobacteriia bacterium]|nr:aminotransferase class I/II-fold pyridoxal phosphate-dependent enzyme [Coriobacteriia bacterium]
MPRIDFSPPDITEDDIAAVVSVLKSHWITTSTATKAFEQNLAAWCKTPHVACLNSATAALECALRVLGIGPGDEVVTSAYTYTASASVIVHVGARPVLVDVAPGSYHLDPNALMAAVGPRTRAVISVDIAGLMCDYERIFAVLRQSYAALQGGAAAGGAAAGGSMAERLARELGRIPVIADAAHSFGATYHGQPSGSLADLSAFSFHAVKN